jgi:hypothetical protein
MKNYQQGFVVPLLITIIVLLVLCGGTYVYLNQSQNNVSTTNDSSLSVKASTSTQNQTPLNEKASGYIKSAYTKNGKNYIDIDYVEFVVGGPNGVGVVNNNPKIRTFEISNDTKLLINSFCIDKNKCTGEEKQILTFDQFSNIINKTDTYLRYNPWDIVVKDNLITSITEHFMP